ncbi:MAG: DUF4238 domain-containing protein [Atopobiaceae bacterium]|nr:DUF4238 domain-containing protein [Atopobiaceae bacterium]
MAEDTEKKRNNHYVPQMYLRQWSNNGNTVWTYDTIAWSERQKVWESKGVGGLAYWRDFYTQANDDDSIDDSIEKLFGDEYEWKAGEPLRKVRDGETLGSNDMSALVDFAILQMVRTPLWYMKSCALMANVFPSATTEVVDRLESEYEAGLLTASNAQDKTASQPDSAPFPQFAFDVGVIEETSELKITMPVGRKNYLAGIGRILNGEVGRRMRGYNWSVVEMPDGVVLPTCDNPFVRLCMRPGGRPTLDGSVGDPDVHLFMPLTPHHLLFAHAGGVSFASSRLASEPNATELIAGSIVQNALRYVYDCRKSDWITRLRPRRVDPGYCNKMADMMKRWNEIQD